MVDDPDIWRGQSPAEAARPEAVLVAAQRADELLVAGDVEGCAVWKRILVLSSGVYQVNPTLLCYS